MGQQFSRLGHGLAEMRMNNINSQQQQPMNYNNTSSANAPGEQRSYYEYHNNNAEQQRSRHICKCQQNPCTCYKPLQAVGANWVNGMSMLNYSDAPTIAPGLHGGFNGNIGGPPGEPWLGPGFGPGGLYSSTGLLPGAVGSSGGSAVGGPWVGVGGAPFNRCTLVAYFFIGLFIFIFATWLSYAASSPPSSPDFRHCATTDPIRSLQCQASGTSKFESNRLYILFVFIALYVIIGACASCCCGLNWSAPVLIGLGAAIVADILLIIVFIIITPSNSTIGLLGITISIIAIVLIIWLFSYWYNNNNLDTQGLAKGPGYCCW